MRKDNYKSTKKSETIDVSKVDKPNIGRYIKIDGKFIFIPQEDV
tara:strand:+ start:14929 stop:15060 length:132 start_codon:yes stop_codon:yes gene_type:complete